MIRVKKTGRLKDDVGAQVYDRWVGLQEECIHPEHPLNRGYTVWVHAYSSKEAKAIALQRINEHKAQAARKEEESQRAIQEANNRLNLAMEDLRDAA